MTTKSTANLESAVTTARAALDVLIDEQSTMTNALVAAACSLDADRVVDLQRRADELPARLVVARIAVAQAESAWHRAAAADLEPEVSAALAVLRDADQAVTAAVRGTPTGNRDRRTRQQIMATDEAEIGRARGEASKAHDAWATPKSVQDQHNHRALLAERQVGQLIGDAFLSGAAVAPVVKSRLHAPRRPDRAA